MMIMESPHKHVRLNVLVLGLFCFMSYSFQCGVSRSPWVNLDFGGSKVMVSVNLLLADELIRI